MNKAFATFLQRLNYRKNSNFWPKMVLGCELELLQPYFLDVFRLYKPSLVGKTSSLLTIFLSFFFQKKLELFSNSLGFPGIPRVLLFYFFCLPIVALKTKILIPN